MESWWLVGKSSTTLQHAVNGDDGFVKGTRSPSFVGSSVVTTVSRCPGQDVMSIAFVERSLSTWQDLISGETKLLDGRDLVTRRISLVEL